MRTSLKIKYKLKKFIYETLKKREKNEYKELLNETRISSVPWFYLRVLVIGLIIYSFGMFFNQMFDLVNYSFYVSIGAVLFGITYFILIYEMIKKREVGLLKLLVIALITGVISLSCQLLLTLIIKVKGNLLEAIRAGTLEEVVKGISSIVTVLVIQKVRGKKIDNITALLIGCSVGLGFGVIENFDYLFKLFNNEVVVIELTFIRGLQLIVTHMFWTGIITYSFFKIKNKKDVLLFGLTVIGCMALHVFWDINEVSFISNKVYPYIKDSIILLISIFEIFVLIKIINKNNKEVVSELGNENIFSLLINKLPIKRKMVVKIFATLLIISFLFLQSIYIDRDNRFFRFETSYEYYKTYDEFYDYMSGEYKLEVDRSRPYNTGVINYDEYYVLGKMKYATQIEEKNDIIYLYRYISTDNSELVLDEVRISIDGEVYDEEYLYDVNDESNYIVYYHIIEDSEVSSESEVSIIRNANFVYEDGNVLIEHVNKKLDSYGFIMFGLMVGVIIVGFSFVIIDYRRYKKVRNDD